MRDAIIIAIVCLVAIVVGAWLFFASPAAPEVATVPTVLAKGNYSGSITERTNYRIRSEEELDTLWQMLYPAGGPPADPVDFENQEVLAVFDGTHASGGYGVTIESVEDTPASRVVRITHSSQKKAV